MEIRWRCVRPMELDSAEWMAWDRLQADQAHLRSPYYHPMFTRLVADVREDVYVAVGSRNGQSIAFFPFQKEAGATSGRPVGSWLNDFHGVIAADSVSLNLDDMLKGCGLSNWRFSHLPGNQSDFLPFSYRAMDSPFIDLSQGLEAYIAGLRPACHENLRKQRRIWRREEREGASWRFAFDSRDEKALAQLISWKSAQYNRSGLIDVFQFSWVRQLITRLHEQDAGLPFRGILSTLHLGKDLVAAHFGLYCRGLLHYWFPGYDVNHARSTPGNMLLLAHIERGYDLGVRRIDLGKGMTQFKKGLMSGTEPVFEGALTANKLTHQLHYGIWKAKHWIEQTPFFAPLRFVKHAWLGWDGSHGIR
jgi:CelD/BcsL family acetyltransferase involved in cellulose biosynthesis